jgi:hypothetical protein
MLNNSCNSAFIYRRYFPYVLDRQPDGRYAILNREYKPVGLNIDYDEWIDYDRFPVLVRVKGLTRKRAAKIAYDGDERLDYIYLYDDGCNPFYDARDMTAYCRRLAVFMKLVIVVPEKTHPSMAKLGASSLAVTEGDPA